MPPWTTRNDFTAMLERLAGTPADGARGDEVEVESGLLICSCGRWFPIERSIPELLPDHLRDATRDTGWLEAIAPALPEALASALRRSPRGDGAEDTDIGTAHKRAEIGIAHKVADQMFFAPGYSSPFADWDPPFSIYLIKLFGAVAPLLRLSRGDCVVDSGCGYAWTTEWLFRSGFDPIGVDICRTYLEVGLARMGVPRPHLVIGDVESLPLAAASAKAVLAYESFHHIPDRPRAIRAFERVLEDGGIVILAEPGAAHEHAPVAIDAMQKYGILEKGMELVDVRGYAGETTFGVEQVYQLRLSHAEIGGYVDSAFVAGHSAVEGNLFKLTKGGRPAADTAAASIPAHEGLMRRLQRYLKSTDTAHRQPADD
jgi:SAM-dependent methyltransferase/uncharacterized protein YbaR (Trm112 family)